MFAFGGPRVAVAGLLLSSLGYGLGFFNLYAIGQTLAGPVAAGKWVGLQNCIGNISGIVAPIVSEMIVDATGQFSLAFLLAALIAAIGLVSWTVGIRRKEPIRWAPSTHVDP